MEAIQRFRADSTRIDDLVARELCSPRTVVSKIVAID